MTTKPKTGDVVKIVAAKFASNAHFVGQRGTVFKVYKTKKEIGVILENGVKYWPYYENVEPV